MFFYFGYGSNINMISLRAKGVNPFSSERAFLRGWELKFNVEHWFKHEGGMGNIEPSSDAESFVEGMLHACPDEGLALLDAMESKGVGYDRVEVEVETLDGSIKKTFAYVGLPAYLNESCLPTRRYLSIILKGAKEASFSPKYISKLESQKILEIKDYPSFNPSSNRVFTFDEVKDNPNVTVLSGFVFDMSECRPKLAPVKSLFGGKDMTLFHAKRHDSSTGTETMEDIKKGKISTGAKNYLNAYLHEYEKEFQYLGRMEEYYS